MTKVIGVFSFLLLLAFSYAKADDKINVRLFTDQNVSCIEFTAMSNGYRLKDNDSVIAEIPINKKIKLTLEDSRIRVKSDSVDYGSFEKLKLDKLGFINSFKIKPIVPQKKEMLLDDGLIVYVRNSNMYVVNNINIDYYVAGVAEAEAGRKANIEFYKAQTILCRTYVLSHLTRHVDEGYNICDKVHCQVYHGKCKNSDILMAAISTRGMALVDSSNRYITSAFYANCGGQTCNSEDVWTKPVSYLKSVRDTFCTSSLAAKWEKKIPKSDFIKYLQSSNCSGVCEECLEFKQYSRKVYFDACGCNISLAKLRNDWKLRSTYFSITMDGNMLHLKGRGNGHGVGLCQEGAMRMANYGYTYDEIIKFYYKGVRIKYQNVN